MKLNTDCMVPIEDVNYDFSKAAGVVDTAGMAVIIKDNKPRYVILDFSEFASEQKNGAENLKDVAGRILEKNHSSIEEISSIEGNSLTGGNDFIYRNNTIGDSEPVSSITLNDILSLNDDYKADDVFGLYNNNISEETIFNLDQLPAEGLKIHNVMDGEVKSEGNVSAAGETKAAGIQPGDEMSMNLDSYTENNIYIDEATKRTIEELKELLKGKE